MARPLFNEIVTAVIDHDPFFRSNIDCAGKKGISGLLKTSRTALDHFCQAVMHIYGPEFLRKPTVTDIEKLYLHHEEKHGFPGMLGSLDCTDWEWFGCPYAFKAHYVRRDHGAPVIPFVANGVTYRSGYYLVDGIYLELSPLVKTILEPADNDHKRILYKQKQESARKDVERAFGVLNFLPGDPIRLDFKTKDTEVHDHYIVKGNEVIDEDLRKPFKEARRTTLTRQIIEFAGPEYKMPNNIKLYDGTTDPKDHLSRFASAANSREWPMPVWCRMFQQTLDGSARGWFEHLPHDSINEWADLREAFAARFSVRRACFKEPHEITKIIRKANESLTAFKERWTVETGFIMGVPEVMKISSFMDSVKSPELAKRFSNKVPTTVNEMMERLDDFVRFEEAYVRH
ncbi:reverse transcriptase domain-containing protein [Tanacetum coccineum]|uniref:Reverse transcriptase domain-containing protein n=1 Tax=Tanacetum coccineum TaxID=301880 RepID=A0ABQ5FVK7_9ASTR